MWDPMMTVRSRGVRSVAARVRGQGGRCPTARPCTRRRMRRLVTTPPTKCPTGWVEAQADLAASPPAGTPTGQHCRVGLLPQVAGGGKGTRRGHREDGFVPDIAIIGRTGLGLVICT